MKNAIFALLILSSSIGLSQSSGFGIKGGLNYGSTGDITSFPEFVADFELDGEDKVGYHFGVFGKFDLAGIFIQPEVAYTKLTTEYDFKGTNGYGLADYNFSKLDVPLLVGIDLIGPLNIKAGPSFQYILKNKFEEVDIDLEDPENSFSVGYQVGAGLTLGQLGIDVRYEGAFSDNTVISETQVETNDFGFKVDSRPSQWIISLSYSFSEM